MNKQSILKVFDEYISEIKYLTEELRTTQDYGSLCYHMGRIDAIRTAVLTLYSNLYYDDMSDDLINLSVSHIQGEMWQVAFDIYCKRLHTLYTKRGN